MQEIQTGAVKVFLKRQAALVVDVFNLLNTSNVVAVGSDLTRPGSFGQPAERVGQLFGSGGTRAVQVGVRFDW